MVLSVQPTEKSTGTLLRGLAFELMVSHANRQLEKMTDRYLLIRDEHQPLELNVVDNYQAGEIRSTKNLSGGESFIVSLTLALGLSKSVRDSFADQLFPGTSTIQTRLRYMLFVPWIYDSLEKKRLIVESFAVQADKLERDLVQPLMDSDGQSGVFGKTAGKKLKRLPSSVYWAGC